MPKTAENNLKCYIPPTNSPKPTPTNSPEATTTNSPMPTNSDSPKPAHSDSPEQTSSASPTILYFYDSNTKGIEHSSLENDASDFYSTVDESHELGENEEKEVKKKDNSAMVNGITFATVIVVAAILLVIIFFLSKT